MVGCPDCECVFGLFLFSHVGLIPLLRRPSERMYTQVADKLAEFNRALEKLDLNVPLGEFVLDSTCIAVPEEINNIYNLQR